MQLIQILIKQENANMRTYRYAKRDKRPSEEGIAPFSVLLDKSPHIN